MGSWRVWDEKNTDDVRLEASVAGSEDEWMDGLLDAVTVLLLAMPCVEFWSGLVGLGMALWSCSSYHTSSY